MICVAAFTVIKGILHSVRASQFNLHNYSVLVVSSDCAQRSLINN